MLQDESNPKEGGQEDNHDDPHQGLLLEKERFFPFTEDDLKQATEGESALYEDFLRSVMKLDSGFTEEQLALIRFGAKAYRDFEERVFSTGIGSLTSDRLDKQRLHCLFLEKSGWIAEKAEKLLDEEFDLSSHRYDGEDATPYPTTHSLQERTNE